MRERSKPQVVPLESDTSAKAEAAYAWEGDTEKLYCFLITLSLEKNPEKFDEGREGVLFYLRLEELPKDVSKAVREQTPFKEGEKQALKVLKVYGKGKGVHEFAMQKAAHEMLTPYRDNPDYADVPEPTFYDDIPVSESMRANLESVGMRDVGDSIEVIMMEHIEGEDVATHLYKEALRRHPDFPRHLQERYAMQAAHAQEEVGRIGHMPFGELHAYVASLFDFAKPNLQGATSADAAYKTRVVEAENANRLLRFLEQQDEALLPSSLISQLRNTITLFGEEGLKHGDLGANLRNIMLCPDGRHRVLDFGRSEKEQGTVAKNELGVVHVLEPLTKSRTDRIREEYQERIREFQRGKDAALGDARWQAVAKELRERGNVLDGWFEKKKSDPMDFGATLAALIEQGDVTRDQALAFVDERIHEVNLEQATLAAMPKHYKTPDAKKMYLKRRKVQPARIGLSRVAGFLQMRELL